MPRTSSLLITLADAIVAALKEEDFGLEFECERNYANYADRLEDLGDLRIDVIPQSRQAAELDSRGSVSYQMVVDVAVRKRFDQSDQESSTGLVRLEEKDRLLLFVEQIHEFFAHSSRRELVENMHWQSSADVAAYTPEELRQMRLFKALVRLTYDVHVDEEE